MDKRTVGIIATIVTALACGLPGIGLICTGALALVGGATNETGSALQNTVIGAVGFVIGGGILILIPILVWFFGLRRARGVQPAPVGPIPPPDPPEPAAPIAPTPQRAAAAPQVQPQAASAPAPAPAPAAPTPSAAPAGLDAASQTVYDRIMALNRPTAPYQIIDGRAQNVDLIAEWKIVDAKWYEVFAKANLTKVFRIHMKLDPAKREVRAQDQEMTVSWKAGVPSLSFNASFFKGQQSSVSFGTGYAFTENLAPGQVYKYKFNTNELKKPIQDAVAACGWTYKGVAFGKL